VTGPGGRAIAPIQLVTPRHGAVLIFKAFALVIIGGMGQIRAHIRPPIEAWADRRKRIGGFSRDRLARKAPSS